MTPLHVENAVDQPQPSRPTRAQRAKARTLLLLSEDQHLLERLKPFANSLGYLVVRTRGNAAVPSILQATQPAVVLLDLDLPGGAAWETAELLLQHPDCPAAILLTARIEDFDAQMASRAGPLLNKNESTLHLLRRVEEVVASSDTNQAERNAIQRLLLRQLKPTIWAGTSTPAYRFWGINE